MATNTQTPRHKLTILEGELILELASVIVPQNTGAGTGDMTKAVYDPQTIEADAFDMANMTEGADAKVMTAAERAAISALGTASTREADQDLQTTDNVEFAEVTADTVNLHTAAFDTTNGGPTALGEVAWDGTDGTLDLMADGGVKVALGEDGLIRVRNTSGTTITKGAPLVYLGTNGASTKIDVGPWTGATVSNVRTFLGFAAGEMLNNTDGYATWFGKIKEIATDGGAENWDDGDILYAVPGVSSTLTNIQPTSGDYVTAAVVINAGSGTSGSMFVRPTFDTVPAAATINYGDLGDATTVDLPTVNTPLFTALGLKADTADLGTAAAQDADQNLGTTDSPSFQSLTLNNGLSASELLVYGSDDGAGNYTRASFTHSASGDLTIATEAEGTGTAGDIVLSAGNGKVFLDNNTRTDLAFSRGLFYSAPQGGTSQIVNFGWAGYHSLNVDGDGTATILFKKTRSFRIGHGNNSASLGTEFFRIESNGDVGIGTTTPARKLHVSDAMRLEPTTAPASPSAGDLYFDSSTNKLRCYDGTAWNDLF